MVADVDIANAALRALGANRITGLDDGSKNANAANDIYTQVRDDLLRAHNWNFATTRASLSELGSTPGFGFDHQHALPADWIRTVSVHDNDAGLGSLVYKEEVYDGQKVLLTDSSSVYLRYVKRVTDANLYPADFVAAFSAALASQLAVAIPNSLSMKVDLEKEAGRRLMAAKSSDSMGQTPERRPPGSWLTSRHGWPSNRFPR